LLPSRASGGLEGRRWARHAPDGGMSGVLAAHRRGSPTRPARTHAHHAQTNVASSTKNIGLPRRARRAQRCRRYRGEWSPPGKGPLPAERLCAGGCPDADMPWERVYTWSQKFRALVSGRRWPSLGPAGRPRARPAARRSQRVQSAAHI